MSVENNREKLQQEIAALKERLGAAEAAERTAWDGQATMGHLVDSLPGMAYRLVYENGDGGRIEFLSSGTELLTGYAAAQIIREPSLYEGRIVHPEDVEARRNVIRTALERHEFYQLNYRILTRQGVQKWVAERGLCQFGPEGAVAAREGFVHELCNAPLASEGNRHEIQDLREKMTALQRECEAAERQRQSLQRHLRHSQRLESLGTLALGLAHDFNNILQAILGYGRIAAKEVSPAETAHEHIGKILTSAERAHDLTMRLLTFCGEGEPSPEPQYLDPLLRDAVRMLRSVLPATVRIELDVYPEAGVVVGDTTLMLQVFVTLGTCVARSLDSEGGTLEFHLSESCFDRGAGEDAPPGLADGVYTRVCVGERQSLLESLDRATRWQDAADGNGENPGLAVVQDIVRELGGNLTIWQNGTRSPVFRVFLPAQEESETCQPNQRKTDVQGESLDDFTSAGEHVLFIDDEQILVELGTLVCEELGYRVTACRSSRDALSRFENDPASFDVVLTDQTMPDLTGFELAQRILHIRPDIPIILTTGYSEMVDEVRSRQIGIREYLMKPLTPEGLAAALRRVLDA